MDASVHRWPPLIAVTVLAACLSQASAPTSSTPYLDRLARFRTKLVAVGPAPQDYTPANPPPGARQVVYESDGMQLAAWLAYPQQPAGAKLPAVVFFHGGFALDASDFAAAQPFLQHGFVLMTPMLRGENGNPGTYEMFLGEVRDAQAAVEWLAQQERIDPNRIYTFGHSAGGAISALLSLRQTRIRHGGSSGGLYHPGAFRKLREVVPFTLDDPREAQMRTLVGNVAWMKTPHYAFVGLLDSLQAGDPASAEAERSRAPLVVDTLWATHNGALPGAIEGYLEVLRRKP